MSLVDRVKIYYSLKGKEISHHYNYNYVKTISESEFEKIIDYFDLRYRLLVDEFSDGVMLTEVLMEKDILNTIDFIDKFQYRNFEKDIVLNTNKEEELFDIICHANG